MKNQNLNQLLQKEMTRQEFMATLGFGLASIMGFSTIIHLLTGKTFGTHGISSSVKHGYGSTPYGGGTE